MNSEWLFSKHEMRKSRSSRSISSDWLSSVELATRFWKGGRFLKYSMNRLIIKNINHKLKANGRLDESRLPIGFELTLRCGGSVRSAILLNFVSKRNQRTRLGCSSWWWSRARKLPTRHRNQPASLYFFFETQHKRFVTVWEGESFIWWAD